jgi:hypothetical protein
MFTLVATALLAAAPAAAVAQTCLGNPSFTDGHLQLAAGADFDTRATSFGAAFGGGSESVFGSLGVGGTTYDDLDGTTVRVSGTVGYQVPVSAGRTQVCPVLSASLGSGPNDFDVLGTDLTTRGFGFGVALGTELARGARVALVPAVTLGFAFSQLDFTGSVNADTSTDTYGLAGIALGVVLNNQLSIRPSVNFPLGLEGADPTFGIGFALNYGGRR